MPSSDESAKQSNEPEAGASSPPASRALDTTGMAGGSVEQPAKLLRLAAMTRELLGEVRQVSLNETGRERLRAVHQQTIEQLRELVSEELQEELDAVSIDVGRDSTEAELRLAQAQLLGWLGGLFQGIQAAMAAQQAQSLAAQQGTVEEQQRQTRTPGSYL